MLTCKDATRLISLGQERPLGFRERLGLRLHLWICHRCRLFQRQVRFLRRVLREMGRRAEAEGGLSPEARERIREALAARRERDD